MIELQFVKILFRFGKLYDLDDCIPFSPAWDLLWLGSLSGFSCEIPSINAAFAQDCSIGSDHHLKSNDFEHLLLLLWPITSYRRFRKFLKFWSYFVKSRGSDINRFEQMITSSWREFLVFQCSQLTALCSRNFQNVKLGLTLLKYDDFFTATQIYVKSNFGAFKRSKNVIFGNSTGSESWFLVNLSNFHVPKLPKFKVLSL